MQKRQKHTTQRGWLTVMALTLAAIFSGIPHAMFAEESPPPLSRSANLSLARRYQAWGETVLKKIDDEYFIPSRKLYSSRSADTATERRNPKREVAMMWACGVQLSALGEAAKMNARRFRPALEGYAKALDVYIQKDALGGYDIWPCPKPKDRYYDDNIWVVLALIKGYETFKDPEYLQRAEASMRFVLSGEDTATGGGIYWKEDGRAQGKIGKHACSTGPTIVAALKLHRINKNIPEARQDYLATALRLHAWMRSTLQDQDGLYWDNIQLSGKIGKEKYSYNSALMVRAECLLYEETGDKKYLEEAQRVANACLKRWVRQDGSMDDGGRFGHLMMGAFLELYLVDRDTKWLKTCDLICEYIYEKLQDPNGLYPGGWGKPLEKGKRLTKVDLLDQASVAHAFLETAATHYRDAELRR